MYLRVASLAAEIASVGNAEDEHRGHMDAPFLHPAAKARRPPLSSEQAKDERENARMPETDPQSSPQEPGDLLAECSSNGFRVVHEPSLAPLPAIYATPPRLTSCHSQGPHALPTADLTSYATSRPYSLVRLAGHGRNAEVERWSGPALLSMSRLRIGALARMEGFPAPRLQTRTRFGTSGGCPEPRCYEVQQQVSSVGV